MGRRRLCGARLQQGFDRTRRVAHLDQERAGFGAARLGGGTPRQGGIVDADRRANRCNAAFCRVLFVVDQADRLEVRVKRQRVKGVAWLRSDVGRVSVGCK